MARLTDSRAFVGESLSATFNVPTDTSAVSVVLKTDVDELTLAATQTSVGVYSFTASAGDLASLSGQVRWLALATITNGVVSVGSGSIYLRPLQSKWRAYVAAIDAAIETWGTNPNQTVTVGEVSMTAKSISELIELRETYASRAKADEAGTQTAGGPRIIRTVFR